MVRLGQDQVAPVVLPVMAHKGGVGKTTLSVNLAARAAASGYRTLLISLDTNGSAERLSGYEIRQFEKANMAHILAGRNRFGDVVEPTDHGYYLAPAADWMESVEYEARRHSMQDQADPNGTLRRRLDDDPGRFDLIVIDTPATVNTYLTLNALYAATHALAVFSFEPGGPEAMAITMDSITVAASNPPKGRNPVQFVGLVGLRRKTNNSKVADFLHGEVAAALGQYVMEPTVREASIVQEAAAKGIPAVLLPGRPHPAIEELQGICDVVLSRVGLAAGKVTVNG